MPLTFKTTLPPPVSGWVPEVGTKGEIYLGFKSLVYFWVDGEMKYCRYLHNPPFNFECCYFGKLPITEPLKLGSPVFLSVNRNRNLVLAIMKNCKNGCSSQKMYPRAKDQITDLLKVWFPDFRVLTETKNWCQPLWKIEKMAVAPQKCILEQNSLLPTP